MKINSYSFGEIIIDGNIHTEDVIIFPDKIENWWRNESHKVYPKDIETIIKKKPDLLIIGNGAYGVMNVNKETKEILKQNNIEFIIAKTDKACEIYNKSSGKNVIAALHLTC